MEVMIFKRGIKKRPFQRKGPAMRKLYEKNLMLMLGRVDRIQLGFDLFKRGPGIGHDEVCTSSQFFKYLVAPATGPSFFSGGTIEFFIYLSVGFADEYTVVEKRTISAKGTKLFHNFHGYWILTSQWY